MFVVFSCGLVYSPIPRRITSLAHWHWVSKASLWVLNGVFYLMYFRPNTDDVNLPHNHAVIPANHTIHQAANKLASIPWLSIPVECKAVLDARISDNFDDGQSIMAWSRILLIFLFI